MGYEYEEFIEAMRFGLTMSDRDSTDDIWKMVDEVVNKAKAFDEINKILDVYLGNVEDELNALNLIREKLEDMEDE